MRAKVVTESATALAALPLVGARTPVLPDACHLAAVPTAA